MVGDRIPFAERQIALSRLLTAILTGQLTGSVGSGLLATYAGWRASMAVAAVIAAAALVMTVLQLHARRAPERPHFTLSGMRAGYAEVFANPRSPVCFAAVFIGGIVMFGLFPYIAILLEARGAGGLKEAGFVLAGFGIGGILYTALVVMMLRRLGLMNLIRAGGLVAGLGLASLALGASWPAEMAAFVLVGVGFYMVHNSLQTQATELAPNSRGAAVAAHAFFFFLGQACGPVVYALALPALGQGPTLVIGALVMAGLGFATAHGLLVRGHPARPSRP
jgi:predicted MFS family arabinose efflux permease